MGKPKRSFLNKLVVFVLLSFGFLLFSKFEISGLFWFSIFVVFIFLFTEPKDVKRRKLTFDELAEVIDKKGARCERCGARKNLSIDHIRPLSKGGDNSLSNLRVLCRSCNSKKKDKWRG